MTEKEGIMRPTSNVQRPTSNVQLNLFRKTLITFLRIIISSILATVILTLLCKFYFNLPMSVTDESGATDKKYDPDTFFVFCTEGFSWGRTNNDGYLNSIKYEDRMPLDVLITGSSHMEAFNIAIKDNTASQLARQSDRSVYSIGMSGHSFPTCAVNLEAALKKYTPSEYVVIEAGSVNFSDKALERIISKNIAKRLAFDKGIAYLLKNNDFLRLMNAQFFRVGGNAVKENLSAEDTFNNPQLLNRILNMLYNTASSYGVKLIIAYHPSISLNKDGSISINGDPQIVKQFSELCNQNGIYFLDMSSRFLNEYARDFTLPYGFRNTSVGKGHMNKYGHRMFAEEIYKLIQVIESQS